MYHVHSRSAQPNVSPEEFQHSVIVPIPKGEWRDRFVTQIKNQLEEAQSLRNRYFEELQKSKDTFEKLVFENL